MYLLDVSHYISVYIALYQKKNILVKLKLTFYTLSQEAKQIIKKSPRIWQQKHSLQNRYVVFWRIWYLKGKFALWFGSKITLCNVVDNL